MGEKKSTRGNKGQIEASIKASQVCINQNNIAEKLKKSGLPEETQARILKKVQ